MASPRPERPSPGAGQRRRGGWVVPGLEGRAPRAGPQDPQANLAPAEGSSARAGAMKRGRTGGSALRLGLHRRRGAIPGLPGLRRADRRALRVRHLRHRDAGRRFRRPVARAGHPPGPALRAEARAEDTRGRRPRGPRVLRRPAPIDADHAVRVGYGTCRDLWRRGAKAVVSSFAARRSSSPARSAWVARSGWRRGPHRHRGRPLRPRPSAHGRRIRRFRPRVRGGARRLGQRSDQDIRMVCPHCYERVPYPAYACPGPACARRHQDIRPGRFGTAVPLPVRHAE